MKINIVDKRFNLNQKRDRQGRWVNVGAGIGALTGAVAGAGVGLVAGSQARQKLPPGVGADQLGVLGAGGGWIAGSLVGGKVGGDVGLKAGEAYDRITKKFPKTGERLNAAADSVEAFVKSPKVRGLVALGIGLAPLMGAFLAASQDRTRGRGGYSSSDFNTGGGDRMTAEEFDKQQGWTGMSAREKRYAVMYESIEKSDGAKEAADAIAFYKEVDSQKSKITIKSGDGEEKEISQMDFLAGLLIALDDSSEDDVIDFMAEQLLGDDYDDELEGEEREKQRLLAAEVFSDVIDSTEDPAPSTTEESAKSAAGSAIENSTKIRIVSRMR